MQVVRLTVVWLLLMSVQAHSQEGIYAVSRDRGCTKLYAAFEKTRNSERYQEITFLEQPEKDLREQFRSHFIEARRYEKLRNSRWKIFRRELTGLNEFSIPTFFGCVEMSDQFLNDERATIIKGTWRRGANKAISMHWISKSSGKVMQSERTFTVVAPEYILSPDRPQSTSLPTTRNYERPSFAHRNSKVPNHATRT